MKVRYTRWPGGQPIFMSKCHRISGPDPRTIERLSLLWLDPSSRDPHTIYECKFPAPGHPWPHSPCNPISWRTQTAQKDVMPPNEQPKHAKTTPQKRKSAPIYHSSLNKLVGVVFCPVLLDFHRAHRLDKWRPGIWRKLNWAGNDAMIHWQCLVTKHKKKTPQNLYTHRWNEIYSLKIMQYATSRYCKCANVVNFSQLSHRPSITLLRAHKLLWLGKLNTKVLPHKPGAYSGECCDKW